MAVLTVTKVAKTGATFSLTAAAGGGDSFPNTGKEMLAITNGGVGSINVTIAAQVACGDFGVTNAAHDLVVAVGAGVTKLIGPFPPAQFNDANGRVQLTYSGVTSVTVNPFSFGGA
jgi:hypothetical protein